MRDETTTAAKKSGDVAGKGTAEKAGWFGLTFGLDHANRELRVCMTRAVAGVSVAGFCGLMIGVVAVARNASHNGPQSARASASIIEPAAEDGLPKVMPPKPQPAKPRPAQVHTAAKPVVTSHTPVKAPAPAVAIAAARPKAMPTTSVTPGEWNKDSAIRIIPGTVKAAEGRTVGHNYLVFGSYPSQSAARRASQKLRDEGVACTIERSLPGWTKKGWYSVVGVKGYETTTKNRAYQTDVRSLRALGFDPSAYRWRKTGGA